MFRLPTMNFTGNHISLSGTIVWLLLSHLIKHLIDLRNKRSKSSLQQHANRQRIILGVGKLTCDYNKMCRRSKHV